MSTDPSDAPGRRGQAATRRDAVAVNLALQGGGAHGAFTWGVLDRLLEDDTIDFGWISATSAGAVNAAALCIGLARGGRDDARSTLASVWNAVVQTSVPDLARINPWLAGSLATLSRSGTLASVASMFSPYEFNPLGFDPLRKLLEEHIDVALLRSRSGPEVLIAATDVATGIARLFRRHEISIEAILASACLPTIHHAVEIEGRAYWDGGFSANPDLITIATECEVGDTLIVQLSPLAKPASPKTAREIAAHISHITFNRPYVAEIEAIVRLREAHALQRRRWRPWRRNTREAALPATRIAAHRFHLIDGGLVTSRLPDATKAKPEQSVLDYLFRAGRTEASKWLERHGPSIGKHDTAELAARLAGLKSDSNAVAALVETDAA